MDLTLRPAAATDCERIADILISARSRFMPYAPSAHPEHEVRAWVQGQLVPTGNVIVAVHESAIVGVMAVSQDAACSWINHMAVDPERVGRRIGSALVAHALDTLPLPIRLYTFQQNQGARRFYERNGFRAVEFSDGRANEEHCPDVLYEYNGLPGVD